ncbi:MAG: family 20 glycosylhydrolase [Muribaculaceae bacterium]|nr:family 20 glycosylhydrolase [Muribaculaceae bacterium]
MKIFRTTLIVASLLVSAVAAAVNPKPFVIPELRQWDGKEGSFTPTAATKIVCASEALRPVAEEFAADWATMFGARPEVTVGKAAKGDIYLSLKMDKKLGKEGYTIDITDKVTVAAPEAVGAYWATRTLLQIAEQAAERSMPCGKITDYPDYALRGLSMDVGRKFFPMDYLKDLVKALSYYKMNSLRIHLNDNGFPYYFGNDWDKTYAAFRMESDSFPGLTARDGYYTKKEFRDFQRSSALRFVDIVPEIDIPAHALAFSKYKKGIGSKEFGKDHLDLFHPETMPFMDAVFEEYLGGDDPVFINEYVHIGTDEFGKDYKGFDKKKETAEKFRAFMDHYIRLVESYGKKPWVWGSLSTAPGETPIKTEGVMLDAWYNGYADPKEMIKLGFKLNSIPDGMVYIVPAAGYYQDYLNTEWLYNNWTPARVGNVQFEEKDPNIVGGYFAVWNDHVGNGVSVQDVHHRIMPALQTMSVKLWDGVNATIPYADFNKARLILSEAPGLNRLGRVGKPNEMVYSTPELKAGSRQPIKEIGYDYTVEFDIDAVPEAKGTQLLSSPDAVVYLSDPVKGLLGFARDGYLYTFNFKPYPGEKAHLRISGNNAGTTLWVNGEKYESLDKLTQWHNEGKNKMYYLQTLVFPLEQAGDFKSRITDFKVYNYIK